MLLKTIFGDFYNDQFPTKMEAVNGDEVLITLKKVDNTWNVFFSEKYKRPFNIPSRSFDNFADGNDYFQKCVISLENMITSQLERDEAEKELKIKDSAALKTVAEFISAIG